MENLGGGYGHKLIAILLSLTVVISGWILFDTPVHAQWSDYNITSYNDGVRERYGNFGSGREMYLENTINGIVLAASGASYPGDAFSVYGPCYLYVPKKYGHIKVLPNLVNGKSGIFLGMFAYMSSNSGRPYLAKIYNCYAVNPTIYFEGDYIVAKFNEYARQGYNVSSGVQYMTDISRSSYATHIFDSYSSGNLYIHPALDVESITGSASGGGHNWSGSTTATCTSAGVKTCADCGYSESTPALGHSENSGSVTTNPTCTTAGVKTFNCSRCGAYLRSASVPASGHSWGSGNGAVTQNQSCTLPEIRYNKCTKCSATNGTKQTKSALGHNYQPATLTNNNGVKIEPTVYNDGTYYQKCSRCSTGHSGDPYTNHYNAVPGTQKHFSIYVGDKRVQAIYLGDTPIMNANIGNNSLVA